MFPGDTGSPEAQGSCLGYVVLWIPSYFKVCWGVIFWLRTNLIHCICLPALYLHGVWSFHWCLLLFNPSTHVSVVVDHSTEYAKQEIFGLSLAPRLQSSPDNPSNLSRCHMWSGFSHLSPHNPFSCAPTGWGWDAGTILSAPGEKGRNGREDEEH